MIDPRDRWEPWSVDIMPTGGPERIYDNAPTTETVRPVGFTAPHNRYCVCETCDPEWAREGEL